jgi:hypothetical protein
MDRDTILNKLKEYEKQITCEMYNTKERTITMDRNTILNKLKEYEKQITREIYNTEYDLCCSSTRNEIFLGFDDEGNYEIFTVPVGCWGYDTDYSVYLGTVGFGEEKDLWSYRTFEEIGYVDNWDVIGEIAGSDITKTEDGWLYKDEEYYNYYDMADAVIEDNQDYWENFINEYCDYECYLYREWWDKAVEHFNKDWEKRVFVQECEVL